MSKVKVMNPKSLESTFQENIREYLSVELLSPHLSPYTKAFLKLLHSKMFARSLTMMHNLDLKMVLIPERSKTKCGHQQKDVFISLIVYQKTFDNI